jgi:hypothetical protein
VSHAGKYPDYEPESFFVADVDGGLSGVLFGALEMKRFIQITLRINRPPLLMWVSIGTNPGCYHPFFRSGSWS